MKKLTAVLSAGALMVSLGLSAVSYAKPHAKPHAKPQAAMRMAPAGAMGLFSDKMQEELQLNEAQAKVFNNLKVQLKAYNEQSHQQLKADRDELRQVVAAQASEEEPQLEAIMKVGDKMKAHMTTQMQKMQDLQLQLYNQLNPAQKQTVMAKLQKRMDKQMELSKRMHTRS